MKLKGGSHSELNHLPKDLEGKEADMVAITRSEAAKATLMVTTL